MSRGVLLFAFNIENVNYYEMAVSTAKRVKHFLNLPSTLITNNKSLPVVQNYNFDKVITLNGGVSLSAPLLHISRQPKNDILMNTWYIVVSDFNFTSIPEQISGIKFRFTVDRSGRVFDDTVQLSLDNE